MGKNRKGFTLAELLVVVAILGVIAVIAIPIFTKSLEKSREEADIANLRDAKAAAVTCYLNGEYYYDSTGTAQTIAVYQDLVKGATKWDGTTANFATATGVYFDNTQGILVQEATAKTLKGYGKGTTVNGGADYYSDEYDNTDNAANQIIKVCFYEGDGSSNKEQKYRTEFVAIPE